MIRTIGGRYVIAADPAIITNDHRHNQGCEWEAKALSKAHPLPHPFLPLSTLTLTFMLAMVKGGQCPPWPVEVPKSTRRRSEICGNT